MSITKLASNILCPRNSVPRLLDSLLGCLLVSAVLLVSANSVLAEATPEATVKEIIGKIKASSSPAPVVEYVDWAQAFQTMPEAQKGAMNIKSADEMRDFYRKVLESPAEIMKQQLQSRVGQIPEAQRGAIEASLKQMEEKMREKEVEIKARIKDTNYEVGKAVIDGDAATVPLKQTYKGETKSEEIKLVKSSGKWLLPSVGLMAQADPAAPGIKGSLKPAPAPAGK